MRRALLASVTLFFALPGAPALADHVTVSLHASARLGERLSDNSWSVIVDWSIDCSGPAPGNANYTGNLNLDDVDTGEVLYMGGTATASGNDLIRGFGDDDCLVGGSGGDRLLGGSGYDRLTGGRGADTLVGGSGVNRYDAGAGNDVVNARNGRAELVSCGSGRDRARIDRRDRVRNCERVKRPRR